MPLVSFFDLETQPGKDIIDDLGAIRSDGAEFHSKSVSQFLVFIQTSEFICGHNIFRHDLTYLQKSTGNPTFGEDKALDTLHFSPLLFPKRPYHRLLKDDKLDPEANNNPFLDAVKAKELFDEEISAFLSLPDHLKQTYYNLTRTEKEFRNFYGYLNYQSPIGDNQLQQLILTHFHGRICSEAPLADLIKNRSIALSYCLALINAAESHSLTPQWVLKNYPDVQNTMHLLRGRPCIRGCNYCSEALNAVKALNRYFDLPGFRKFGNEPLQEKAVMAAIHQKSLLAVFPTGGGKSITFQLPALMSGENEKALTVVISPLQSLMKDQVDNLEKKSITAAVTINGLLDPIERQLSIQRVEGDVPDKALANILYLSPESLRSVTIVKLLLKRKIARFVIDEAHCFSSWGQDFRVDYLYIGDFIKMLQDKKGLDEKIPVSCFTATAKQKVIEDIREYFKIKLGLELEIFSSDIGRTNLHYKVFSNDNASEKYNELRTLIEMNRCPTIIYVSRTKNAREIASQLNADGFPARAFYGKMDKEEKKTNQDAFTKGDVNIMVATSAFGMGVDKNDVGMVIHYQISDSLENYIQEAGRAGRNESVMADCYVLFNEEDLDKHFQLLNQTKLDVKEINQVWRAIKEITKTRASMSNSALEIARKAGWDENIRDIETRVTTAIAALEEAGYVKRGNNMPMVFASSIVPKNAQDAIQQIEKSTIIPSYHKQNAIRIIKKLFSSKSKRLSTDETAESRVDYISEQLGLHKKQVLEIIQLLKDEKILENFKDITAWIKSYEGSNRSLNTFEKYAHLEKHILSTVDEGVTVYNVKEINQQSVENGCKDVSVDQIHTLLNFWTIKDWVRKKRAEFSKNHFSLILNQRKERISEKMQKRHQIGKTIVEYLYTKAKQSPTPVQTEEKLIEFSIQELKETIQKAAGLFESEVVNEDVEDCLLFLSRIGALKIEGGFLVTYNRLSIERLVNDNKIKYKNEDYQKLDQFYKNKVQQIHIVGEYARKMIENYNDALRFVDDYFKLNYTSFLRKYFRGKHEDINRKMTLQKFQKLFSNLSPAQMKIINDKDNNKIVVAAGPGSGKTRVLVHKLASILMTEDVKAEQLLMLTFSRAAATDFKKRLIDLIGSAAHFVEIKTFHSYCFDICGQVGDLEHAKDIVPFTCDRIGKDEVDTTRITKTMLVVDEAQDISSQEFRLLKLLIEKNEDIRVMLVGDDDQNIYEFRKSSSKHMLEFLDSDNSKKYELVENYRSKQNLVDFANQWVSKINGRLKEFPIIAHERKNGVINITQYSSDNMIVPMVQAVLSADLSGTITILTRTNEEAEQITGLLVNNGRQARLIQSHEEFPLHRLKELRFFTDLINQEPKATVVPIHVWDEAIAQLKVQFKSSDKLPWCLVIVRHFAEIHQKIKYKSDWKTFLEESKFEDFVEISGETIYVSTIHKAKGKEFDNVFLMLDSFDPRTDEEKRLFYVACTRAKTRLEIHYNREFLKNIKTNELVYKTDNFLYLEPQYISRNLTLNDVYLSYFSYVQHHLQKIQSGSMLTIGADGLYSLNGKRVLKFSKSFVEQLEKWRARGYQLENAKNNFTVYWWDKEKEKDVEVLLPEVRLLKPD